MKAPALDELRDSIVAKSDSALLRMVSVEAEDYRDDVLELAREELRARGCDVPTPKEFVASLSDEERRDSEFFCEDCLEDSEPCSAPWESGFTRLSDGFERCPDCGAVKQTFYFGRYGLRLFTLGHYRAKYRKVPRIAHPQRLAIRRLK